jgi:hypothetical protein
VPPPPRASCTVGLAKAEPHSTRHRYVELSGAVHLMGEEDWNRAMDETLRWLSIHLH